MRLREAPGGLRLDKGKAELSDYVYTDPTTRFRATFILQIILAIATLGATFAELVTLDFVTGVKTKP